VATDYRTPAQLAADRAARDAQVASDERLRATDTTRTDGVKLFPDAAGGIYIKVFGNMATAIDGTATEDDFTSEEHDSAGSMFLAAKRFLEAEEARFYEANEKRYARQVELSRLATDKDNKVVDPLDVEKKRAADEKAASDKRDAEKKAADEKAAKAAADRQAAIDKQIAAGLSEADATKAVDEGLATKKS